MGELFYSLREGSTASGPGEGPRAQRIQGDHPEGGQDPPVGLCPALRQTVPAVSGGGREQVLGQAGLHPVHAGAGGTPGSLPGIGLQRASWRTGRRTSQEKGS